MAMTLRQSALLGILAVASLFAGCESLSELRSQPPVASAQVVGDYEVIAQCVANEADVLEIAGTPTLRVDKPNKLARLLRVVDQSTAVYEITFAQQRDGWVQVEGRGMPTIHGRGLYVKRLWPLIEKCALQSASGAAASTTR